MKREVDNQIRNGTVWERDIMVLYRRPTMLSDRDD
jgi:hypothetical protein